jgi:hypothetical protein
MSRISLTIHIDIPDGATAAVSNGEELATLPPVRVVADAPVCPIHHKPLQNKGRGYFCSAKAAPGEPANDRGYCTWAPK